MSAITQPGSIGITAQAASASTHADQRRQQEHALVGAGRDDRLLQHELQQVGEGLQQAEGTDHVGAAAHLHRRPDLAVGEQDEAIAISSTTSTSTLSATMMISGQRKPVQNALAKNSIRSLLRCRQHAPWSARREHSAITARPARSGWSDRSPRPSDLNGASPGCRPCPASALIGRPAPGASIWSRRSDAAPP